MAIRGYGVYLANKREDGCAHPKCHLKQKFSFPPAAGRDGMISQLAKFRNREREQCCTPRTEGGEVRPASPQDIGRNAQPVRKS